jgi:DNA polymerase-3 subunit gamma/tau
MDYQVSARKYRPGTFDEVIGQPHVVQTLVNAIATKRVAHAFLFSGTRGVGKTTVARILAKALNCEQGPTGRPCNACANCTEITQGTSVDVVEIDGASNTGVDDVREIRENVKFSPFRGGYRVYIIDEVHMLSNSAFNALLKTLEEPPPHVVFIFATTEIHKIPATILSRCQHYNFRRIPRVAIIDRLRQVAVQDGLSIEDRSLAVIARASEGSMRDALSLLDQAVVFGGKTLNHADLELLLGSIPQELVRALIEAIVAKDSAAALRVVSQLLDQGHDLRAYAADVVERVRNLMVAAVVPPKAGGGPDVTRLQGLMDLAEEELFQVVAEAEAFTIDQLQELFRIFTQVEDALRASQHARFVLEMAAVRATRVSKGPEPSKESAPMSAGRVSKGTPPQPRSQQPEQSTAPQAPPASMTMKKVSAPAAAPDSFPETGSRRKPVVLDWEQVVERVTNEHPHIGVFLEQGIFLGIEGDKASVGYPKAASVAYGRMQRDESIRLVSALCSEMAGQPVRIAVVELPDGQAKGMSMAEIRAAKEREQKHKLLAQARRHPLVQHALGIFGGDVIDARRVSMRKEKES